jgi:hypothetical protein
LPIFLVTCNPVSATSGFEILNLIGDEVIALIAMINDPLDRAGRINGEWVECQAEYYR